MRSHALQIVALFATILSPIIAAAALQTDAGTATFEAVGPGGLRIEGKTSELSVVESQGEVRVVVPLGNLETGISLRNRHMREKYLEVQKFPSAQLAVARASLRFPASGGEVTGSANGQMTIHGQTHPAAFTYTARQRPDGYNVTGAVRINIKDYGIDVPSYLGITVKPDVEIAVHFVARDT